MLIPFHLGLRKCNNSSCQKLCLAYSLSRNFIQVIPQDNTWLVVHIFTYVHMYIYCSYLLLFLTNVNYVHTYACFLKYTYLHVYASVYICTYVHMHVCIYSTYVCIYCYSIHMYTCTCVYITTHTCTRTHLRTIAFRVIHVPYIKLISYIHVYTYIM